MKKRKFVIIGSLQSPLTGSKIRNRAIAKYLARHGCEVSYLEPTNPDAEEKIYLENVNYIKTKYPCWKMNLGILKATFDNWLALRKLDADCIMAIKPLPSSCVPALMKKKAKMIIDIDDLEYAYWDKHKFLSWVLKAFERYVVKHANYVTVHNLNLKCYVSEQLKFPEEKIIFLPQGMDLSIYKKVKADARYKFSGRTVLVYAAFLGVASELLPILKVYQELKKELPKILLVVIGGGEKLDEYKEYCKKNKLEVIFTGYKGHEETLRIIKACDIALNYNKDSFANKFRSPIKVREYLALDKKVVSSSVGDTCLFKNYIYISSDNLKEYKNKIKEAILDKKGKKGGKEYVYKNYDWSKIIKNFLKQLNKIEKNGI